MVGSRVDRTNKDVHVTVAALQSPALPDTWQTISRIATLPWTQDMKLSGGVGIRQAYDSMLAFRLEGSGAMSTRKFVPANAASQDALAGVAGQRLNSILNGFLPQFDGRENRMNIKGILLPRNQAQLALAYGGFVLPILNYVFRREVTLGDAPRPGEKADLAGAIRFADKTSNFNATAADWFIVAPRRTNPLLQLAATGISGPADAARAVQIAHLFVHETEHLDGPNNGSLPPAKKPGSSSLPFPLSYTTMDVASRLPASVLNQIQYKMMTPPEWWIEEATAEVASQNDARIRETAARMGLPLGSASTQLPAHSYDQMTVGLRSLLGLANINTATQSGWAAAVDLLQREAKGAREVPEILAARIGAARGLDADSTKSVAQMIRYAGKNLTYGKPSPDFDRRIAAIQSFVAGKSR